MTGDRTTDNELVEIYLSDHAAAARAMIGRLRRMADSYDGELAAVTAQLAEALTRERDWILEVMASDGLSVSRWKATATTLGELVGRLKLNGRLFQTSPLTPLLELELLASGLRGKRSGWRTMREWAVELELDTDQLTRWQADVEEQIEQVEALLAKQRLTAFKPR
ncbi:hypothetical protein [Pseudactinotalea terrae]|uniref:hypothetical protein n=1 Tax=Pseudactinotalea terrae TaxID=1743262 RepID=UPI0012E198B4|nr:hypothetical protein [Pseudactinotalea terrae]